MEILGILTSLEMTGGCLRGGSWGLDLDYARAAFRPGYLPRLRDGGYGFRVARCSLILSY